MYEGVSVIGFECVVGDRKITGLVKEKDEASATYKEARDQGQAAGLLEQLPDAADVFTATIGNIPARSNVVVNLMFVGELRHDAEVDGLRLTVPTSIAPRYGSYPGELLPGSMTANGIDIKIDISLDSNSRIQKVVSPSHQISVGIGTLTTAPDADPQFCRGSATLATGTTELSKDFILQVVASNSGIPRALIEEHPTIPDQRALMATLVPRFSLKPIKPEIIFIVDRSGSMHSKIETVKAALKVFLKSLPVGVKFNICSFGRNYELLWPRSKAYNKGSLSEAQNYVDKFSANFGGTETQQAVKASVESRFTDIETELLLLTDGDIWAQNDLFNYIHHEVKNSKGRIRVFPIGIGNNVSSALIEGVARAGNGFSQLIAEAERLDAKIIRMLKGALTPHVNDYSLEINYANGTPGDEDDFVVVDKVADSLEADLTLEDNADSTVRNAAQQPISLFDTSADESMDIEAPKDTRDKYAHLPVLKTPKLLQAPHTISGLYPFSRLNVYILLSPQPTKRKPTSLTLRGTCSQGPLELQIPIETAPSGITIHCLAAKKAIQELEEGRGWLHDARDGSNSGTLVKDAYPARFDEIIEREAVRLGVEFQVGGKWCSFVAVEEKENQHREIPNDAHRVGLPGESKYFIQCPTVMYRLPQNYGHVTLSLIRLYCCSRANKRRAFRGRYSHSMNNSCRDAHCLQHTNILPEAQQTDPRAQGPTPGMPNQAAIPQTTTQGPTTTPAMFGQSPGPVPQGGALADYEMQLMLLEQQNKRRLLMARQEQEIISQSLPPVTPQVPASRRKAKRGPSTASAPSRGRGGGQGGMRSCFASSILSPNQHQATRSGSASGRSGNSLFSSGAPLTTSGSMSVQSRSGALQSASPTTNATPSPIAPQYPACLSSQQTQPVHTPQSEPEMGFASMAPRPSLFDAPPDILMSDLGSCPPTDPPATTTTHTTATTILDDLHAAKNDPQSLATTLINAQSFDGTWDRPSATCAALNTASSAFDYAVETIIRSGFERKPSVLALATAVVVRCFETKLSSEKESWELVVEKAVAWLEDEGAMGERALALAVHLVG